MATNRKPAARQGDRRRGPEGATRTGPRRSSEAPQARRSRRQHGTAPAPGRESRPRSGPQNAVLARTDARPVPPKNTKQAKARAKARKAKAPKVVRVPLRERLITRLASIDLRPRSLAAKVPFVVLIIGSLGIGLGITLWLSTDAAERSYQLGNIRERNRVLLQQKEALERDVLTAESAPALAEAARELGMIPTRDTAHLVQDPAGNWVVVGQPKPAEGVPPPPLNTKLPDEQPATPPAEVPVRVPPAGPKLDSRHLPTPAAPAPAVPGAPLIIPGLPGMPGLPGAPLSGPPPGPALEIPPVALPPEAALPPAAVLPPQAALPPQPELPQQPVLPPLLPGAPR
ncbi:hypothetical protein BST10_13050 [Mycolicibacter algericus DSM 45454]|uniref:Uncharacterized protein n=3 Tax=Mycolicibacter algericus TaxID=1288388 RepID=A0A7I9Y7Q0_MYCAL|nr:hypothetical protein [Mycolicibacter algericus]OQZ96210.1 hypothetical protein BST10_13050 [Mycolicibacter algericus DSM 45454]GFG84709.1 hypothetical protein MALGJ_13850 [Mycolicibacter algericus]